MFLRCFLFMTLFVHSYAKINLRRESLLLFMDKLHDIKSGKINQTISKIGTTLEVECESRRYESSVYYRMVYFRICKNSTESFDQFCKQLDEYFEGYSELETKISTIGTENRIFASGSTKSSIWYARQACQNIQSYFKKKVNMNILNQTNILFSPIQPNYTEWLVHATPFVYPIACGFTKDEYGSMSPPPSTANCLSPSYKWALRATYIIDGLIIITITITNVIVLLVSWKTNMINNTHGQLRVSLAIADLLTIITVCGSINTTHTIYFGSRKFTENGEKITILDYITQAYIDGFGFATVTTLAVSIFTLAAISLDRVLALFRPLFYKVHFQRVRYLTLLTIASIWLVSIIIALLPVFLPHTHYAVTALGVIIAPDLFIIYIICLGGSLVSVWILNIWMSASSKRVRLEAKGRTMSTVRITGYQNSNKPSKTSLDLSSGSEALTRDSFSSFGNSQSSISPNKSADLSLARTVRLVVIGFSFAIIPSLIVMGVGTLDILEPSSKSFDPKAKTMWNTFAYISSRLLFANSFFNCFIYSYKSSKFRIAAKNIFRCKRSASEMKESNNPEDESMFKLAQRRSSVKSIQETI